MYSLDAMYLMVCTAMVESKLTHLKQLPEGPALGFFQVEWATYEDVRRYLQTNAHALYNAIVSYTERVNLPNNPITVISDMSLNCLIARTKYYMIHEPIPSYKDVEAQANHYKKYYNTSEGAASVEAFVRAAQDIQGWIIHENKESSGNV
jgi:hypothetical protein